jgi:hypothetical protein
MVHHGRGALRWQKLERLAQEPGALGILRVCWQDKGFNCGRCEKCLRTMVLLRILGLDSPNFPVLDDLRAIEQLVTRDRSEAAFNREALALAKERGDQAVAAALASADRRWQFRRIGRMVGEGLPWLRGRRR